MPASIWSVHDTTPSLILIESGKLAVVAETSFQVIPDSISWLSEYNFQTPSSCPAVEVLPCKLKEPPSRTYWTWISAPQLQLVDTTGIAPIAEIPNVGINIDFNNFIFLIIINNI